jgi:hypothetical protein
MKNQHKPSEHLLISYLYHELEGADKALVEKWLKEDEAHQLEMEEMKNMLGLLSKGEDEEVVAPEVLIEAAPLHERKKAGGIAWGHFLLGAAASAALLLSGIWLASMYLGDSKNLQTRLASLENQLQEQNKQLASFQNAEWKQEVARLDQELEMQQGMYEEKLNNMHARYESTLQASIMKQLNSSETIKTLWAGLSAENRSLLEEYIFQSTLNQQEALYAALIDWESQQAIQREEDLTLISQSMETLALELDYRQQTQAEQLTQLIVQLTQPTATKPN